MASYHLALDLPPDLSAALEQANQELVVELLERGLRDQRIERALERYAEGGVSFGATARAAGLLLRGPGASGLCPRVAAAYQRANHGRRARVSRKAVICNAGPLIALSKLHQLTLLATLYVQGTGAAGGLRRSGDNGAGARATDALAVRLFWDQQGWPVVAVPRSATEGYVPSVALDPGESEVLALAQTGGLRRPQPVSALGGFEQHARAAAHQPWRPVSSEAAP